jgi:hypothetical protein
MRTDAEIDRIDRGLCQADRACERAETIAWDFVSRIVDEQQQAAKQLAEDLQQARRESPFKPWEA